MTKEVMQQAIEAMKIAQDNLRPHGDNCFLHDEGEYNRCFCGKDSLSDHLQSVVEYLEKALKQEQGEPVAMRYEFDGYGYQYIDFGSGSDWQTREKGAEPLYTAPQPKQEQEYEVLAGIGKGVEIPAGWKYYYIKPKLPLQLKQEQGEPVGKFAKFTDGIWREVTDGSAGVLLYITPQECDECGVGGGYALYCLACAEKYVKPEWIGLTHEEISVEWFAVFDAEPGIGKNITNGVFDFANAIEAKLKKKNAL